MPRKTIASILALTLCWSTVAMAAPPPDSAGEIEHEGATQRLDRLMDLVEELRSHIDRSQFDLESLLDRLDYDADDIARFVQEEIAFEPYPGLLRGARGTLMSRAGNALDQAVLLANLLKDAGYDARIARAELTRDRASELVRQGLRAPRAAPPVIGDTEAIDSVISRMHALFPQADLPDVNPGDEGAGLAALLRRSDESLERIDAALEDAGIRLEARDASEEMVEEARDYFWVEYRDSQAGGWLSLHPALSDGKRFEDLTASGYLASEIPAELQFRIRLEAAIDRRLGSKIESKAIMEPWERPAANLIGVPISMMALPNTLATAAGTSDLAKALSEARFFLPLLNYRLAPGALAFDLDGNTIPPEALSLGAAGLFQEMSQKTASAASAVQSLGGSDEGSSPKDMVALERLAFTYRVIAPGGEETSFEKVVYAVGEDPRGETTDATSLIDIASEVATDHTLMLSVGRYPPAYILDYELGRLLQYRPILDAASDPSTPPDRLMAKLAELDNTTYHHLSLFGAFDGLPDPDPGTRIYRDRPSLVLVASRLDPDGGKENVFDILNAPYRTVRIEDARIVSLPGETARRGIRESLIESLLAGARPERSAAAELESSQASGFRVLGLEEVADRPATGIEAVAQRNIRSDLEKGFVVVAPAQTGDAIPHEWWRVDPKSGQTLAMRFDGSGGVTAEDILVVTLIAGLLYAVAGVIQYESCVDAGGGTVCITCSVLTIGFGVASVILAGIDLVTVGSTIPPHVALAAVIAAALKEFGCSAWSRAAS